MDERVKRAMAKWPDVPAAYGWLSLDRRGRWLLKGEPVLNRQLLDYIGRNYMANDDGCWYFQNGPQRVWVELALAPFVCSFSADAVPVLVTHHGHEVTRIDGAWMTSSGLVYLLTDIGPAVMDDRDALQLQAMLRVDGSSDETEVADALTQIADGLQASLQLQLPCGSVQILPLADGAVEATLHFQRQPQEPD